jgi:hypothetical protein
MLQLVLEQYSTVQQRAGSLHLMRAPREDKKGNPAQREVHMQVERTNPDNLIVNKLPDGSKVIVDPVSETLFALNATAGAAWDACSDPTTLSKVAEDMKLSFNPGITEELAEQAILQLQEKKLVTTSGSVQKTTRRQVIATMGAIAIPFVVSLTMAEQRAHAENAKSANAAPPPPKHEPVLPPEHAHFPTRGPDSIIPR